ncbi:MAG: hypothetical protein IJ087_00450 [Eggerthellaceae bacterium]|nr:hypothetical protein [Eggerthellaceae bacterium]
MIRARIWGREVEMQGSPWTFLVYRREFGGDLLSDIVEAYKRERVELADFLKFAWAMCRTRSDEVEPFDEWCRSFPEFTLGDGEGSAVASVIGSAIEAELFRARSPWIRRWWRTVRARRLGRV